MRQIQIIRLGGKVGMDAVFLVKIMAKNLYFKNLFDATLSSLSKPKYSPLLAKFWPPCSNLPYRKNAQGWLGGINLIAIR